MPDHATPTPIPQATTMTTTLTKIRPQKITSRVVDGVRYIVPDTGHWANWRDMDAIVHHGVALVYHSEGKAHRLTVSEIRESCARHPEKSALEVARSLVDYYSDA